MQGYYGPQLFAPKVSSAVKLLVIANVACWFFLVLVLQTYFLEFPLVYRFFGFTPSLVSSRFFIWQFFTYMFLHGAGVFHILFNMLILWMFGSELERLWGKKFFLIYYFVCGVGSALIYFICIQIYLLFGGDSLIAATPVVGASGAIFGLLLAYGLIFGERMVLFMFFIPMRARHFIILIAAVELLTVLGSGLGGTTANLAHLGGLISGLLFLKLRGTWQKHLASSLARLRGFKTLSDDE